MRGIRYVAENGEVVHLLVEWPEGSGRIPPPELTFHYGTSGKPQTFIYAPR
jgi:hypothetical protein